MPWWVYAVSVLLVLAVVGRMERRLQYLRRRWVLWRQGHACYSDYVADPVWKERRNRWIREHGNPPCRLCDRRRWALHHLAYWHACRGRERDRDLMPVCEACHVRIHRWNLVLRQGGVPLRWTSWLCVAVMWPVRLVRARRVVTVR